MNGIALIACVTATLVQTSSLTMVATTGATPVVSTTGSEFAATELPPVEPGPEIVAIIEGPPVDHATPAVPVRERPRAVIRTILALIGLAGLAYLAGHARVLRMEERLGITQVITAGFPFVVLGLLARTPAAGILTDRVLGEMSPLLRIGLGWMGFVVGYRFHVRHFAELPSWAVRLVLLVTTIPFALVLGTTALLLAVTTGLSGSSFQDPVFVRDALILGTAAAMTAPTIARMLPRDHSDDLARVVRLEELAGIAGLAIVAAYFRPAGAEVTWQLPGLAWMLLTLGLGVTIGLVVHMILLRAKTVAEFSALTLGSVSLAAGVAGYLHLSSVVVAFIAGAVLANVASSYKKTLGETLGTLERPIYFLSLVIVGALWDVADWRGWALVPVFAVARLGGKWIAVRIASQRGGLDALSDEERDAISLAPLGPLAIAIVVNAQVLYPGGSISRIVSAVIGGAILTEIAVQAVGRAARAKRVVA